MNKDALMHLTKYNVWANAKVFSFITEAGEAKADIDQSSSFSTTRKTLLHIWDAETIWIKRLSGEWVSDWPSKSFTGTLENAGTLFFKTSKDFVSYVEEKTEEEFNTQVRYKTMEGKEFSNPVWQIIMHCMNHSTFHRGQIITMLRSVGFTKFTSTDYITFCRV
jgi:uncharacterized damage-inducible protein DinB